MYDTTADGSWNDIAHWQNVPEWESIHKDTIIAGTPFNQISKFVWDNYISSAFALAITADSFATASNTGPYCTATDSIQLIATPGGDSSYIWTGPDSFSANGQNVTGPPAGTGGVYTVTVTNALGCSQSASTTVVVYPPFTATASNTGPYCSNDSVHLSALPDGDSLYNWTGPDSFSSNVQNPTGPAAGAGGTYTVVVTNNFGCTQTAATTIVVYPAPDVTASNTGPYCSYNEISLTATSTGAQSYIWSGPNSFGSTEQDPTLPALNDSGTYTVTVTNGNGCTASSSTDVAVNLSPTAIAGIDTILWVGDTIQLNAFSGVTYSWTPPTNISCTDCGSPYVWPDSDITYYANVGNDDGCFSDDSVHVMVRVRPIALLFVPNVITPNGDGYNDTWVINDLDKYPVNDVRIVNRWGDEVFSQSPYQNNWGGTWKGEKLPGGTYYYILRVLYNGDYVKFDGPLTIIR
jgi:gliding motility-associated-like protein